jgi:hypothetical protein
LNARAASERALAVTLHQHQGHPHLIALLAATVEPAELRSAGVETGVISFVERWTSGADQLLAMLSELGAPRPLADGERIAREGREFLASRRSWHTVL